tara:strand:+ start:1485 stop:2504 length:1020 start_codon:yes stop_codon:yes gene_type:complete
MKAGIIGLGHGERVLLHAFNHSGIEVHGISSKNFNKAKKIGKLYKISNIYKSWKNLIKNKDIDIVAIAIPAPYQIEIIIECIKKNKLILSEKPIGTNINKIDNLFKILEKYKKFFLIDYIFPEHNAFKKFKETLSKQKTYKEDSVSIFFNLKNISNKNNKMKWKSQPNLGGGLINLYLSHIVDYLVQFFGSISKVECKIKKRGKIEKDLNCLFTFNNGLRAEIVISKNSIKNYHAIKYYSKKFNLFLINNSNDYCKGFKIKYFKKNFTEKGSIKEILYKNNFKLFNGDSRIILSSKIIDKFKTTKKIINLSSNIERYKYNEYVLNKCRISSKKTLVQRL